MHRAFVSIVLFCLAARDAAATGEKCETDHAQLLQSRRMRKVQTDEVPYTLHDLGGKSVYLIMPDRFSRLGGVSQGDPSPCTGNDWCNGTIKGITSQLEYIRDMGFDCIWVTPMVLNMYGPDGPSGYGYHGYWAQDYYQIDPNFGTQQDLKELIQETHNMGMCFILDIVLNHCRPIHSEADLSEVYPFNKTEYLGRCFGAFVDVQESLFKKTRPTTMFFPRYFHQLNISNMTFDQYTEKMGGWPPPTQALGPGAQCELQFFPNGTPDGTNNGTYCNNYPGEIFNNQTLALLPY